jgi:hypothetical protein
MEINLAHIAKVGKVFLIGSGVAYPLQRGILKATPKVVLPKKNKRPKTIKRLK